MAKKQERQQKRQNQKVDKRQLFERGMLAAAKRIKELEAEHMKISRFLLDAHNYMQSLVKVLEAKGVLKMKDVEKQQQKLIEEQREKFTSEKKSH